MGSLRQSTQNFERFAFESALRAQPADRNAASAFEDWLQDNGYSDLAARRERIRVIREATGWWMFDRMTRAKDAHPKWWETVERYLRQHCRVLGRRNLIVEMLPNSAVPVWEPVPTYVDTEGNAVDVSEAVAETMQHELRLVIRRVRVRVGAGWISAHMPPPWG